MLFSGRDVWRSGLYAYGGAVWAPTGFEDDGLLLKILFSGGVYRYFAGNLDQDVLGAQWAAAVMPGWRFKRGPVEIKIFFGPEIAKHRLWPDDPDNRLRGDTFGVRFAAEFWTEPTPLTMVAADASLSSVGPSYSARLAFGWKVFQLFYLGPEAQVYGADNYDQLRFGAHHQHEDRQCRMVGGAGLGVRHRSPRQPLCPARSVAENVKLLPISRACGGSG